MTEGSLQNSAIVTGTPPRTDEPASSEPSTVEITVSAPLPRTGGMLPAGAVSAGLLLLIVGAGLVYLRRRREEFSL